MTEEELARHDSKTLLQLLLSADARIDALTAEREAFEQDNHRWKMECENFWRDRERILTTEREAFEQDNHRWKMECENFWRDRERILTTERDAAKAKVEQLGCELNVAKYGQPNFAWSVHVAAMAELQAERERLALAICGGDDAPGYANAQTVETLEHVVKQNRQSHWATINSLLAAEAERDRLREALEQIEITCEEEIRERTAGMSEAALGKSRILPLLQIPRNIARAFLKGESHE